MSPRWQSPQPYEEIDHTADAGVVVQGESKEETLARLVLALGQLLAGGASVPHTTDVEVEVEAGPLWSIAVDVLREVLFRFDRDGIIPQSCEVRSIDEESGASVVVGVGKFDSDLHAEGLEPKAVTLHEACFDATQDGYRARIIFDL